VETGGLGLEMRKPHHEAVLETLACWNQLMWMF
jgi:hypothetical protein